VNGDEYMELLEQRRAAWEAASQGGNPQITPKSWVRPLLEQFVEAGDENLVDLPERQPAEPKPVQAKRPRVYRSAASLREERDRLQARRAAYIEPDNGSAEHDARAIVNVSTQSKNRAARASGRRRHARNDRQLREYAALTRRIQSLDSRIAKAAAREERAAVSIHNQKEQTR
jgi:hypothetical protein